MIRILRTIIRMCVYTNTLDNLDEMDIFLEIQTTKIRNRKSM